MRKPFFKSYRTKLIFSLICLAVMIEYVFALRWTGLPWQPSIIDSLVSNTVLIATSIMISTIVRYYLPRSGNLIAIGVVLTILWLLVSRSILLLVLKGDAEFNNFYSNSLPIRIAIGFLLIGLMTLISVLWYTQQEQKETENRRMAAEKMTKEAELFKLRQQLQPHFLFNSLNSISALVGTRPEEARRMIQQLSDFLRGTLKKEEHQWISLKEELQYLQLYLDIEKVRFGNRLSTVIESDENSCAMKIPALLLQPLVENAIKFGLYDTTGETVITLKAAAAENILQISVENPFDPETSSPKQGTGFGLSSVQRRLYLLFGRNDLLSTSAIENTFITTVKIPQA
ncbi:MAG: sensor histidine kinase [Sphingobacteriales bacterium]